MGTIHCKTPREAIRKLKEMYPKAKKIKSNIWAEHVKSFEV